MTSGIGYVCLYDKHWKALGGWTQHIAKSWSLTKKAQEADEFKAVCSGFENSKEACFVGLHTQTGKLKYACFCGVPKTTLDGLTTITGIDMRLIFDQVLEVDYAKVSPGGYVVHDVTSLFEYLLSGVFTDNGVLETLGIDYQLDLDDLSFIDSKWNEAYISRTKEYRNIYEQLQAVCACYDVYIEAQVNADTITNDYKLTFAVKRIIKTRSIKLKDYDVTTKLNQNIVNRVVFQEEQGSKGTLYLNNDNSITETYDANKCLFPPKTTAIIKKTLEEAKSEAYHQLNENRFKDRVVIDLNSKIGAMLRDLDFSYYGDLVGYNPADSSSIKRLPVTAYYEDSKGAKTLQFGRLSKYWFLD